MCRFLVYKGSEEILLSKLILSPAHSVLKQSFDARLRLDTRRGVNNADGFGIAFYTDPKLGQAPCLFTSTTPAWNCANLQRLASKTASRLVFAHVRAATEASLSEDNCHPFTFGSLSFMHNGGIGGWRYIKRRLAERLADRWYLLVKGGTDSEWAFSLFLDTLERMGHDPAVTPPGKGFGGAVLRQALLRTIAIINELTDAIPESIVQSENVDRRSLLNFAVTDGFSVVCTRYISSATDQAASLYYSSGTQWEEDVSSKANPRTAPDGTEVRDYQMARRDRGADIVLVASEPLTFERENWINVPTNSILTIHNQTVMVHPIVDRYYNGSPAHDARSTAFVQTKGLTANEKVPIPPVLLDATTPGTVPDGNPRRLVLSPVLGTAMAAARSRTPDLSSGLVPTLPPPPPPLPISQSHGHQQSLAFRSRSPVSQLQQTHGSIGPEVPAAKVAAGPAASSSVSHQTPSLTSPPTRPTDAVAAGQRQPSQGNIKKKRRSLQSLEQLQAVAAAQRAAAAANGVLGDDSDTPLTPLTPDDHDDHLHGHHHSHIQSSTSHGNPNKIARYFPELTLG